MRSEVTSAHPDDQNEENHKEYTLEWFANNPEGLKRGRPSTSTEENAVKKQKRVILILLHVITYVILRTNYKLLGLYVYQNELFRGWKYIFEFLW